jgi:hypothetical protein
MKPTSCPELDQFLLAYPVEVAKLFKATRNLVLKSAGGCNEIVYDAYSAVATGYTFTEGFREAFCHIAAYSQHVNLGFNHGARMKDDAGLLQGSGKQIRHITIRNIKDLDSPHLKHFIGLAVEQGRRSAKGMEVKSRGKVFVKQTSGQKRRPLVGERPANPSKRKS